MGAGAAANPSAWTRSGEGLGCFWASLSLPAAGDVGIIAAQPGSTALPQGGSPRGCWGPKAQAPCFASDDENSGRETVAAVIGAVASLPGRPQLAGPPFLPR